MNCRSAINALQEEVKKLQQQLKKERTHDLTGAADQLFNAAAT